MKAVISLMGGTALAVLLAQAPAMAAEKAPAVSAPNVKLDVVGGALGGGPAALGSFTGTVPLGHDFGFQLDGAIGTADRDARGGLGGHVFYRDPETFMLGATAMWSRLGGPHHDVESTIRRVGAEAEFYLGDYTFQPSGGLQNDHGDTTGYATLGFVYYPTDNLALGTSLGGFANSRALQVGFEYQPFDETPISFLFDTGIDNMGPGFVLAGLRYSFGGPSKTVKGRDRYDDPFNIVRYMNTVGAAAIAASANREKAPPVTVAAGGGAG